MIYEVSARWHGARSSPYIIPEKRYHLHSVDGDIAVECSGNLTKTHMAGTQIYLAR